jgi:hypothetical protein
VEGLTGEVVPEHVLVELVTEVVGRGERTACDDAPVEDAEHALDLVEPGGVLRREVAGPSRMSVKPIEDVIGVVSGEVVHDEVASSPDRAEAARDAERNMTLDSVKMNRFTLAFDDAGLEREFLDDRARRSSARQGVRSTLVTICLWLALAGMTMQWPSVRRWLAWGDAGTANFIQIVLVALFRGLPQAIG